MQKYPQKNVGYQELKHRQPEEKELPSHSCPTGRLVYQESISRDAQETLAAFGEHSSLESLRSQNPASEFFLIGMMFEHLCSLTYVLQ